MTVNPGTGTGFDGSTDRAAALSQDADRQDSRGRTMATYRGPTATRPAPTRRSPDRSTGRRAGWCRRRCWTPTSDSAGSAPSARPRSPSTATDDPAGFGPALQVVTDQRVDADGLRHRAAAPLGRRLQGDHESGVPGRGASPAANCWRIDPAADARVRRRHRGDVDPRRAVTVGRTRGGGGGGALLPSVLADARQVAVDSRRSMAATLVGLADSTRLRHRRPVPGLRPPDVAALLRWLADGHFVLLGYQRCPVRDGSPRSIRRVAGRTSTAHRRASAADGQRRPAGAGAGDHAELPALRRVPATSWSCVKVTDGERSSIASSACSPSRR